MDDFSVLLFLRAALHVEMEFELIGARRTASHEQASLQNGGS